MKHRHSPWYARWFVVRGYPGSTAGAIAIDPDEYIEYYAITRRRAEKMITLYSNRDMRAVRRREWWNR